MTVHAQPQLTTITSSTELSDVAPLRAVAALPWVLIDSTFVFTQPDGRLLNFEVVLRRPGESIGEVRGQLVGDDYACSARAGAATWDFSVDARISSLLGDSLRPFTHLPNLRVGQCWRLQSVDPLSLLAGKPAAVHARLVRVVAREEIEHAGRRVGCFRIETEGVTAWADERGRVLLQRVTLPILGTWELRDEPFDGEARRRARHTADPASADAGGSARSQGLICVAGGSR
jgi:hypothetical protein